MYYDITLMISLSMFVGTNCCITTGIPIKIIPFNTILKDINET